jgi:hypothetical protein
MKIQFGTPLTTCHVVGTFFCGCFLCAVGWYNVNLQYLLGDTEEIILSSRGINVTRTSPILYCQLPYEEILCSALLKKSNDSENCITDVQLAGSRVLPIFSFFLQICLVQELFSLIGDRSRVIVYFLWIASIFIFIAITVGIFWSSCFHAHATLILFWISTSLFFLSYHNLAKNLRRIPSSSHNNTIIVTHGSRRTRNVRRVGQNGYNEL